MTDQPKDPYEPEDDHGGRAVGSDWSSEGSDAAGEPTSHLDPQDPAPEPTGSEMLGADELEPDDTRSDLRSQRGEEPSNGPQHAQPQQGQPQQGQPPYGQPFGSHDGSSPYGATSAGWQHGQSQQGQAHGPAGYGQQYAPPPYEFMPQYGGDPYGQAQYGQAQYGQAQYGQAQYGQAQYGQPSWGGAAGHHQYDPAMGPRSPGGGGASAPAGGFFGAVLDFRFNHVVTTTITRSVYALLAVFLVLWYLVIAVAAFDADVAFGVLWLLVIGPITVLVALALARMTLELFVAVSRVAHHVRGIDERASDDARAAGGRSA